VKKTLSILLKVIGGTVGLLLVLLLLAAVLLNTQSVQNKILRVATERLEEKLQTRVKIDDVSVNVFTQEINLKGLEVEDQQQRKMLELDLLSVSLNLRELMARKVTVSKADIEGVRAKLLKPKDGTANYQFVIDAFKKDKSAKKDSVQQDTVGKKKDPMTLDVHHFRLAKVEVLYNDNKVSLDEVTFDKGWLRKASGQLKGLQGQWEMVTKKGPQTAKFRLGNIHYAEKGDKHDVTVGDLHFAIDNHKPRKNAKKPKRGFFDVGHLDVTANMKMTIDYLAKDSVHAQMTEFVARDSVTGFNVKDFRFFVGATKKRAILRDITVQQESTVLKFDSASIVLPSKKEGRKFSFQTSVIKGKAQLKDISRPFAPVLKNFKMPLELSVVFSGTDTTLVFKDIDVHTPDKRLTIVANGGIQHLKKKEALDILFNVKKMTARGKVTQEIINQFTGKKLMMKQLEGLGDITYTGTVHIPYRREEFKGVIGTAAGKLDFFFAHNDDTHYVTGKVDTKNFQLGKVLSMKDIGNVGVNATFKVDIDKKRTALVRKKNGGGKAPIGDVKATVYEASYKGVKVKNLLVDIKSNGVLVEGNVSQQNKGLDWACDFSFTDMDKMSDLKVKPKMKLKLGNLFKKKDSGEKESKKNESGEKKESFFKRLFKKKKSQD
jgi:hypothetical protein